MDAWQTSIEGRVGKNEDTLTDIKVELATIKERVSHLPSKDYIIKAVVGTGAVLAVLNVLAPKLQALLGLTH